ncbi:MAG: 2-amino-4-hydroxy-6-hydroxymethyldihydropteridine diphosphokinase [Sulfurospirillum sp.]
MKEISLSEELTLIFESCFPVKNRKRANFKHMAIVGIGGNIGDVKKRFRAVYRYFLKDRRFWVLQTSPILKNPPFGYKEQNYFLNAVLVLQTSISAQELLKNLLHVEKLHKRKRSFKNAPRSLDLDIIFFDNLNIKTKNLKVPHPGWHDRVSVTIPLGFIERIAQ